MECIRFEMYSSKKKQNEGSQYQLELVLEILCLVFLLENTLNIHLQNIIHYIHKQVY